MRKMLLLASVVVAADVLVYELGFNGAKMVYVCLAEVGVVVAVAALFAAATARAFGQNEPGWMKKN